MKLFFSRATIEIQDGNGKIFSSEEKFLNRSFYFTFSFKLYNFDFKEKSLILSHTKNSACFLRYVLLNFWILEVDTNSQLNYKRLYNETFEFESLGLKLNKSN